MRCRKQLSCARVDGEARNGYDRETRRRHCPRVGSGSACKLKYTKVRRGEQVTADVVESDTVDRLVADRRASALKVCPSRRATDRIISHREDVTGLGRLSQVNDELVVA